MWIAPFFHREVYLLNQPVHCLNACFLKESSTKVKEQSIAEKTFTAENAENAEGLILKQKGLRYSSAF